MASEAGGEASDEAAEVTEAADLATPPARLDDLSRSARAAVRCAVAANASARPDALLRLADEFPQEVIDNPALPLHLLSDSALFASLTLRTLEIVLQKIATPEPLLRALLAHPDETMRAALASSPRVPFWVLDGLSSDPSDLVRRAVACNEGTPPGAVEALSRDARWPIRAAVAGRAGAPVPLLEALAADGCADVRVAVAKNPSAPTWVQGPLARDRRPWVRRGVAGNPAASAWALGQLADDADPEVRHLLRGRRQAPQGGGEV